MKYIPKSIPGAALAGLYLLLMGYLIFVLSRGEGGLHGDAAEALIWILVLTGPVSWIFFGLVGSFNSSLGDSLPDFFYLLYVVGIVLGVLINAVVLYLIGTIIGRIFVRLFGKRVKPMK